MTDIIEDGIPGWQRNLIVIWIAQFVALAGFSVCAPILPLYVRELGAETDQAVRLWSGIIFSAPAVSLAIFSPIWGALSDRMGRKIMFVRAAFGGAAVIGLMGLVTNVQQLAVLRTLQGMLTGTVTASTVLVATTVPKSRTGASLGMLQMAIYAGSSAGPLLGGFIADTFGYRVTFYVTSALLVMTGVATSLYVRERAAPKTERAAPRPERAQAGTPAAPRRVRTPVSWFVGLRNGSWRAALQSPAASVLIGVLVINLLTRLGPSIITPVLALFVESLAPAGAPVASLAGLVSGASAAAGAVGSWLMGRMSDRLGFRPILNICTFICVASYALHYAAPSVGVLMGLQAVTGFAMGGILSAFSAYLASVAPQGQEGTVYGISASISSTGQAIGPVIGSALSVWSGLRLPFLFASATMAASGIYSSLLGRRRGR